MIVFRSKHSPDVIMLERVALEMIKGMGHGGSVPGALAPIDLPAALARLEQTVAAAAPTGGTPATDQDDDERREPAIPLAHRAGPLLAMLRTALREGDHVLWEH